MATESYYRVSIIIESVTPDQEPSLDNLFRIVGRTEGVVLPSKDQAFAYLGQLRDAEAVCCDPEQC